MDKRHFGRMGEDAAAVYLKQHGYRILEKNLYIGHAEIDLLAENDSYLVFVEVKTRRQIPDTRSAYGSPASAVDTRKQTILLTAAETYIREHESKKIPRIDVVEVYVSHHTDTFTVLDIRHFENAVRKKSKFGRRQSSSFEIN